MVSQIWEAGAWNSPYFITSNLFWGPGYNLCWHSHYPHFACKSSNGWDSIEEAWEGFAGQAFLQFWNIAGRKSQGKFKFKLNLNQHAQPWIRFGLGSGHSPYFSYSFVRFKIWYSEHFISAKISSRFLIKTLFVWLKKKFEAECKIVTFALSKANSSMAEWGRSAGHPFFSTDHVSR